MHHIGDILVGGHVIRSDAGRAAEIRAHDIDAPDAGGPRGLKAQIEAGERVDFDARSRRIARP